ncbi:hypothetical protein WG78_07005 [Amantichitinum ursilacus]|uniref:Uncharacterized protein n=1 Tax=Amantichitinum ursilacus TaxID=857265 RepID=A0A0N0GPV5_9NEIS|nr:hypothetical protein WG78_07005 [Amantichitinum ursilacus]
MSSRVTRRVRAGACGGRSTLDMGFSASQRHSHTAIPQACDRLAHSRRTLFGVTSFRRRLRKSAKCSGPRSGRRIFASFSSRAMRCMRRVSGRAPVWWESLLRYNVQAIPQRCDSVPRRVCRRQYGSLSSPPMQELQLWCESCQKRQPRLYGCERDSAQRASQWWPSFLGQPVGQIWDKAECKTGENCGK